MQNEAFDGLMLRYQIILYLYTYIHALVVKLEVLLKSLSSTKVVGLDEFSMKVIKYIIKDIYVRLSAAFNSSFVAGIFLDALKHAKLVPVFNSGDKFNISNYSHITVLPILSKILEWLMYNRLIPFIIQKKCMRMLTNSHRKAHAASLFKEMSLLTVYDINKLQIACYVYKSMNSVLPHCFANFF